MRSAAGQTPHSARATCTFISLTGPAGNIGDALIRRGGLEWSLGSSDELVAYVGDAPDDWLHQLRLPSGTRVLRLKRSIARWLWLIITAPRHPVLVFEPGEVPLDRGNAMREFVFLLETLIVRIKRGVVVRPPRGIRAPTFPSLWLHTNAARLSQIALWRDSASAALVGGGRVVPDIGFAAGIRPGLPHDERGELVVSLRGTRPHPGSAWVAAIRQFAASENLRIRTVVQVREDESRSRTLAEELGGDYDPWAGADPVAHEARLRGRYDAARMVISDRLHVLILAALSGAVPIEFVPSPTQKISQAFSSIAYGGISLDAVTADSASMQEFLRVQASRRDEVCKKVRSAAAHLDALEAEVRATIGASRL